MKKRLDQILVDNGLVESKTRAQALIMAGQVYADGRRIDKAGTKLDDSAEICVKDLFPYVSRGALKLEKAHQKFDLDLRGKTICDIGSSTGGFTDYVLQHGAEKVFAVDVGTGQLAQKIREDNRVVVMEKTDFRDVSACKNSVIPTEAEESSRGRSLDYARDDNKKYITEPIDMFVCDVSFISLKKIIPKIKEIIFTQRHSERSEESSGDIKNPGFFVDTQDDGGAIEAVLLIKPQFEAGVKEVSKGKGVIRDEILRQEIVKDVENFAIEEGFKVIGIVESPITGAKGNVEYLLYLKY